MNNKNSLFVLIGTLLYLNSFNLFAQISCNETINDISTLENIIAKYRNARSISETYQVGINAIVVHPSGAFSSDFSTAKVLELISHANSYFNEIGITFYLSKNEATHVFDSNYSAFKTTQEAEIRKKYDVTTAINLYFFKTISDENGTFLNGTAPLPNLAQNSNRVFLSYLDNSSSDFEILKSKVFLHELGHYFGLLHTFQDSNNDIIAKRELVLRDIGSGGNCNTTGDLLCDTQADPYERLASISSYDCNEKIPTTLVDALGYNYIPPTDNLMSYHFKCGNVFTAQQYQRMQKMFSIRFSPTAAYNIIGNQANSITITSLNKSEYCEGETVKINYETFGDFGNIANFFLEMSDENGENFSPISANFSIPKSASFSLPTNLVASSNYRLRIGTTSPYIYSTLSDNFTLNTVGILSLAVSNSEIRPGGASILNLSFSGSGPWVAVFDNGITINNIVSRNHKVTLQPLNTTTYSIKSAAGKCGNVPIINNATVNVISPSLFIGDEFKKNICQDLFFQIPVTGLINYGESISPYNIKLTNADTTLYLKTYYSNNYLISSGPKAIFASKKFLLSIEGPNVKEYTTPIEVTIRPEAELPTVFSPISLCFNTTPRALYAFGNNLKWYLSESDIITQKEILPPTSQTGKYVYYVTQTSQYGCESKKKALEVEVKQAVTATISGDKVIKLGEQAELSVKFTGNAPYKLELSDGQSLLSSTSNYKISVKPFYTETYTLKNASNSCGVAYVIGSAKVVVIAPLGLEKITDGSFVLFPNPVINNEMYIKITDVNFVLKPVEIEIFTTSGQLIKTFEQIKLQKDEPFRIGLEELNLVDANYILRIKNDTSYISQKFNFKH